VGDDRTELFEPLRLLSQFQSPLVSRDGVRDQIAERSKQVDLFVRPQPRVVRLERDDSEQLPVCD